MPASSPIGCFIHEPPAKAALFGGELTASLCAQAGLMSTGSCTSRVFSALLTGLKRRRLWSEDERRRWCDQFNGNSSPLGRRKPKPDLALSHDDLPLGQGGGASLFVDFPADCIPSQDGKENPYFSSPNACFFSRGASSRSQKMSSICDDALRTLDQAFANLPRPRIYQTGSLGNCDFALRARSVQPGMERVELRGDRHVRPGARAARRGRSAGPDKRLPDAGHFVQEAGDVIVNAALDK